MPETALHLSCANCGQPLCDCPDDVWCDDIFPPRAVQHALEPRPGILPSTGPVGAAPQQFASYGDADSFWSAVESVSVHTKQVQHNG